MSAARHHRCTARALLGKLALAAVAALAGLAGCSGLSKNEDQATRDLQRQTAQHLGSVAPQPAQADRVTVKHGYWIAERGMRLTPTETLPPVFSSQATFNRRVKSLREFAERVALLSGVPTRVTPDAVQASAGASHAVAASRGGAAIPPPSALNAPLPSFPAAMAASGGGADLVYRKGDLKGLLDTGAARFGVSWKYIDGTIEFHHVDTRSFQVHAVPGESAVTANVGNSASSSVDGPTSGASGQAGTGSASRSNAQNTEVRSQLSVFASLEKSVKGMLSTHGGVVSSPATGTLTVTDTPEILARVEKFMERENRTLGRQVLINVTVLSVSLSDQDNYGVNWDIVFSELSRRYGIRNTFGQGQGAASFSASVLNTSASKLAGSSLVINALSTQGRVRKQTSASVAALNHQPVPVQVVRQTAYLKSSQTTITANVGSTTSLTPGVVTSGFTMTVLPSVLDNGTVILQFSTDISTLRAINTVSSTGASGGTQIQTPEVDTRNFLQRVAMKSGQTLVVSGFEQMEGGVDRQGVGTARNFLLGGGMNARSNKDVIVILVTPIAIPGA